ncbi:hypothetical protein HPG27_301 [Helicobacter pylori G27]|uniref:Uncharacterized protein n=1 Tax=Helicobacter pylori (strain G27) TaxID=563041 RepID=B5ZA87_HELPG|nr:hypothetical protein HPG27_301 [Helicobacter pylori G27]
MKFLIPLPKPLANSGIFLAPNNNTITNKTMTQCHMLVNPPIFYSLILLVGFYLNYSFFKK